MDFGDKSSGFAHLKNTVDLGSAESFGPVSGFCQSRCSDRGSDHQFAGVLSANVPLPRFPEKTFSWPDSYEYMYSSIDSVTEMTSGNLVHGSCMVTHGSGNSGNAECPEKICECVHVNCLNCKMETRTIECAAFFTTKVPKAMTLFKKISFDAASIPVSGEV